MMNDLTKFIEDCYANTDVVEILPDEDDWNAINDWYEAHSEQPESF